MPNPHRRSADSERAVLDATIALLQEAGLPALTVERIAARAGVGKQTIYRWWPSKGAVAMDALLQAARPDITFNDTGDLRSDLGSLLEQITALLGDAALGRHFVACLAESQRDPALAERFAEEVFTPIRAAYRARLARDQQAGLLRRGPDLDVVLDMAFGTLWFRGLTRPELLVAGLGRQVAEVLLDGTASTDGARVQVGSPT